MLNLGQAQDMYEISSLGANEIDELALRIKAEGELRGYETIDFQNAIKRENEFILEYSAKAFCHFQIIIDEADLIEIWCDPSIRRKGVARALLTEGLNRLKSIGTKRCFLEVAAKNIAAIKLYQSFNFKQIGIRKQYYKQKSGAYIDAISMKLEIDSMTHLQK